MIHDLTDQGDIVVEHVFSGDLLVGPGGGSGTCATTVRFQEQRVLFDPSPGETIGSSVWLRQSSGGIYHVDAGSFSNSDWTAYDSGQLTAADFTPSGLDLCPSSPSTITFGYSRSSTNASAGTTLFQSHGIDEWSVTISP